MANSFNSIPQTTSLFTNLYQQATQQVNPFGGYTNPPVTQSMTPSIPPPVQSVNPPFAPIPKESQKKYTVPQPKYIKTNGNNEQVVNDFINTYFKYLQENFEEMKTWVGKIATFTYFERTKANSYRHPLFKCIRNYE